MRLPFETDAGLGERASIGLVVLQADETIEEEFHRLLDLPGIALHCSRIPCAEKISPESLAAMRTDLPRAAALLPEGLDAIGYGCTSGSTIIGEAEITRLIQTAHPTAQAANPLTAAKAALKTLNVRRPAFVTPYAPEVSAAMRAELEKAGCQIAGFGSFEEDQDPKVARITPKSCLNAILQTAKSEKCDSVFIACTNLRALGIIPEAEAELGIPVISSNQALAWHLLRLAGIADTSQGFGRLFGESGATDDGGETQAHKTSSQKRKPPPPPRDEGSIIDRGRDSPVVKGPSPSVRAGELLGSATARVRQKS